MLQEILGNVPTLPRRLNALFIVDIHVQVGAPFLGQRDTFIINHGRVLD